MNTINYRIRLFALLFVILMSAGAALADGPFAFYAITPCRIADTRTANGINGGPKLGAGETRDFQVRGRCGIPTTAKAVSLNIAVANATNSNPSINSFLTIWPSGTTMPNAGAINFRPGDPPINNGLIVPVSTNTLDLSVRNAFGQVDVIIGATGYFQ